MRSVFRWIIHKRSVLLPFLMNVLCAASRKSQIMKPAANRPLQTSMLFRSLFLWWFGVMVMVLLLQIRGVAVLIGRFSISLFLLALLELLAFRGFLFNAFRRDGASSRSILFVSSRTIMTPLLRWKTKNKTSCRMREAIRIPRNGPGFHKSSEPEAIITHLGAHHFDVRLHCFQCSYPANASRSNGGNSSTHSI